MTLTSGSMFAHSANFIHSGDVICNRQVARIEYNWWGSLMLAPIIPRVYVRSELLVVWIDHSTCMLCITQVCLYIHVYVLHGCAVDQLAAG